MSDSVDVSCVERAKQGDSDAWNRIEAKVRQQVVHRLRLPPTVDPEEVASDTVTELWQGLHNLRDAGKLLNFATTVARRIALRIKKEQGRHLPLLTEPPAHSRENVASKVEGDELLHSLSSSLKGADEQLFKLLYVVGATSTEVQSGLGITGRVLRQRKHRLHQKLRQAKPAE